MTLKQGDIITHTDGSKRKILGVVGDIRFTSSPFDFTRADGVRTEEDMLAAGYTFPKEKWTPAINETYFSIAISMGQCEILERQWGDNLEVNEAHRDGIIGIFRTEAEAQARIALIEAKLKEI